jgi:hypothetical protein
MMTDRTTHRIYVRGDHADGEYVFNAAETAANRCWIEVTQVSKTTFHVTDDNMTEEGDPIYTTSDFAFRSWDSEVEQLDVDSYSEVVQVFRFSEELRWKDVYMKIDVPFIMEAPSLDRLKEALSHVVFGSYCPGDI